MLATNPAASPPLGALPHFGAVRLAPDPVDGPKTAGSLATGVPLGCSGSRMMRIVVVDDIWGLLLSYPILSYLQPDRPHAFYNLAVVPSSPPRRACAPLPTVRCPRARPP